MPVPELSAIEEKIVLLVASGESTRAVADGLGLSHKTVEWHLLRAGRKLELAAALRDRVHGAGSPAGTEGGTA